MSAAAGALALLLAALLPQRGARLSGGRQGLAALGALALLPAAGDSGAWPFILLAAGAASLATPLPLVLAAGGAVLVALRPEAPAPIAAAVAGLAVAAAADGVVAWFRARRSEGADAPLAAGALLVLVLVRIDDGSVLSWTLGVASDTGRVVLTGAGVALGAALVATLGGVLLLGAVRLAPESRAARPVGVAALWAGLAAAALGTLLALVGAALLPGGIEAQGLAVLVVGVGTLAACLLEMAGPATDAAAEASRAILTTRVAVALAVLAALAAGIEGWVREGTYATTLTAAAAAAALLGVAALEPETRLAGARRLVLLAALLYVLLA